MRNQRRRLRSIGALGGRVFGRHSPGRWLGLGDTSGDIALRLLVETLHVLRSRRHSLSAVQILNLWESTFLLLLRDDSGRDGDDFLSISVFL